MLLGVFRVLAVGGSFAGLILARATKNCSCCLRQCQGVSCVLVVGGSFAGLFLARVTKNSSCSSSMPRSTSSLFLPLLVSGSHLFDVVLEYKIWYFLGNVPVFSAIWFDSGYMFASAHEVFFGQGC